MYADARNSPLEPEPPGGKGGLFTGMKLGGDLALVRTAVKNRWPIRKSLRREVIETLAQIMRSSEADRDRISAAKVLVTADGINVKGYPQEHNHHHDHTISAPEQRAASLIEIIDCEFSKRGDANESGKPTVPGANGSTHGPGSLPPATDN
jgi:hypothetical protein